MKKRLFERVLITGLIVVISACLMNIQGQEVAITFPNPTDIDYGNPDGLGGRISGQVKPKITLTFNVDVVGKIALDASTASTVQSVIDFIDTWDNENVGSTTLESIWGKSFSMILTSNDKRLQCRNGGGLGIQGSNQWRIDNQGSEEVYFILQGEVGIKFTSLTYSDIAFKDGVGNFRIKDFNTDEVWYFPEDVGTGMGDFLFDADMYTMRYKSDSLMIMQSDTNGTSAGARLYGLAFDIVQAQPKPPAVLSTSPVHADTTVETSTDFVILFDGPMDQTATSAAIDFSPDVVNRVDTWNANSDEITVSFDELPYITEYLVTVGQGVLGTNGLNALADTTFKFRTLPEPPNVIYTFPGNLAKNIPLNTPFEIQFSKAMLPDSVEKSISFNPAVSGFEFVWNADNSTVYFTADELLPNTMYFGTVSTVATDIYNIRFPAPFQFTFTTMPAVGIENNEVSELVVYPNPADDLITIRGVNVKSVQIFSVSGKLISEIENQPIIQVGEITPGSYIISVTDQENNRFRELITIK